MMQLIVGYLTDYSADIVATVPIFQAVLNKKHLTSQLSISRFWDRASTKKH